MPPSGPRCVWGCGSKSLTNTPAQYIVDQSGKVVFQHDGEGQYEEIDRTIARLLNTSS
jgi:hypothetical protein